MIKMGVPVATPIKSIDIISSAKAIFKSKKTIQNLKNDLKDFIGTKEVFLFGSGKEALFYCLNVLKKNDKRKNIIIPAFICPSVPSAIRKAGLIPKLCDINIPGYGLDEECLKKIMNDDVLAIIQAHLFGYPQKIENIKDIANTYKCVLIEDCAQSFGSKYKSIQTGRVGEFAIYSFGMSKPLSIFGGGALAVSEMEFKNNIHTFDYFKNKIYKELIELFKIFILNQIIKLKYLGLLDFIWKKYYQRNNELKNTKLVSFSAVKANLLTLLLKNIEDIRLKRKEISNYYFNNLKNLKGILLPEIVEETEPAYLRFPVLINDLKFKKILIKKLIKAGINASEMYDCINYQKILSVSEKNIDLIKTEFACLRMVVLPTHQYLNKKNLENIIDSFYHTFK